MKKIYYLLAVLALVFSACGGGDDTPEMTETINDPIAAVLVFPEENTECNEGVVLNDSQSKVTFRWNVSEYTDRYEVNLQNLDTENITKIESATNSADITLDRGSPYKWYVVSKSENSTETAKSENWQFYNSAPGIVNYAPFPADVIDPVNGSTIAPSSGKATLTWEVSDLDNDITEFEVFYGTNNPPASSSGLLVNSTFELNVASDTIYYWLIKTTDGENNSSESEVFNFTVQ